MNLDVLNPEESTAKSTSTNFKVYGQDELLRQRRPECGGVDEPSNMQWQTIAAGKAKDKTERNCRP